MELVGDRIIVRTAVDDDVDELVEGVRTSIEELAPWLPWATDGYGVDDAREWVSGALGDVPPLVVVAPNGAVIATCSINGSDGASTS